MGDSNSVPVRFFEELDWFKSPAGLRIHQEDNYRSCRLGFLSTLLALFFSYIFINECTKLITFETIKCSSVTSVSFRLFRESTVLKHLGKSQ